MATGLEKLTVLGIMTEPAQRAPIYSTQEGSPVFRATGAGSTTTTVSSLLIHATNGGYVGLVLKCISATNTQNIGIRAYITAFDQATNTLTHSRFPAATAANDFFELWLPPDPVVVEAAGGATVADGYDAVATRDTNRQEADAYWTTNDNLVVRAADNIPAGEIRAVTGFTQATGVFAQTVFSANTAIGDLYHLRQFPKWWGPPEFRAGYENIPHESQRGNFDLDQSINGSCAWTANGALPLKPSGTVASDGVAGVPPPELDRILSAAFTRQISTGEAIINGTNASTIYRVSITEGMMSQFPVGTWCMDSNGRAAVIWQREVVDGTQDLVWPWPVLDHVPTEGTDTLYGGVGYTLKTTGHLTMTFEEFTGGVMSRIGYGGIPTSIQIVDFTRNTVPKIRIGYAGNVYVETDFAKPAALTPVYNTVRPRSAMECCVRLGIGSGATATAVTLQVESATVDLGVQVADEPDVTLPDATYGKRIVGFDPTITMTLKLDTASPNDSFAEILRATGSQPFGLLLQHGRAPGSTVGVCCYRASWQSPAHNVADNLRKLTMVAKPQASTVSGLEMISLGFI